MHGMVYLMKSRISTARTKFGYRTKLFVQDVRNEVDEEYGNEYECFAIYNLGTDNREETENLVKQIRYIISIAAGTLESTQPEYYMKPSNYWQKTQHTRILGTISRSSIRRSARGSKYRRIVLSGCGPTEPF